jgi:hypothetical protein
MNLPCVLNTASYLPFGTYGNFNKGKSVSYTKHYYGICNEAQNESLQVLIWNKIYGSKSPNRLCASICVGGGVWHPCIYEACPESKDTKVLNTYKIFNLQKRHCEWIACT